MQLELNAITALNILLLAAIIQCVIVFVLLWVKPVRRFANRLLAGWILVLALSNWHIVFLTSNLQQIFGQRFTLFAPITLNLLFGPLIFLFVKATTQPQDEFRRQDWRHLFPGVLEFAYYSAVFVQPLSFRQQFYGAVHWRYVEPTLEVIATLSFIVYLVFSVEALRDYRNRLQMRFSDPNLETYDWLRRLLMLLAVFAVLWLVLTIIDVFFMGYALPFIYFYPYYLFIAFLSYFVGFSSYYRNREVVVWTEAEAESKIGLSMEQLTAYQNQLQTLMEEQKLFLNPRLRAQNVANELGLNVQTLSLVLNKGVGLSFHDYINQQRVEHFIERLSEADLKQLTLLGIAQDSGFNSESSFYRIFKKYTGYSPKAYFARGKITE